MCCILYGKEHAMRSYVKFAELKAVRPRFVRLIDGERRLRYIFVILRNVAKEKVALRSINFSTFIRICMIKELSKKGN